MSTLYSRIDSRQIPIYSLQDTARYLRIPASTIRSWTIGHRYSVKSGSNFFAPLIEISPAKPYLLSFTNLVEIHVLRAIRQHHQIQLSKVSTDGIDLFVEHYGALIQASQSERHQLEVAIHTHIQRIEADDQGLAIKLYPFTRSHEENNPRIVVVDPRIAFGRLTIDGTGIATSILKERYSAGDSIDELAADYECDRLSIEEAIRCELSPFTKCQLG
jgi:uncharacterized protein (DUF433 family)